MKTAVLENNVFKIGTDNIRKLTDIVVVVITIEALVISPKLNFLQGLTRDCNLHKFGPVETPNGTDDVRSLESHLKVEC